MKWNNPENKRIIKKIARMQKDINYMYDRNRIPAVISKSPEIREMIRTLMMHANGCARRMDNLKGEKNEMA